jgi:hypothetical protein
MMCKVNAGPGLARAMLSRSLHSPMHLKCIAKVLQLGKALSDSGGLSQKKVIFF